MTKRLSSSYIYPLAAVLSLVVFLRPITVGAGVHNAGSESIGLRTVVSEESNSYPSSSQSFVTTADPSATSPNPLIDVWYGLNQRFGHIGNPQRWVNILGRWVNILGNASGDDGIASLTYSLNGGVDLPLTIGPDNHRLAAEGDFNVEIDYADLVSGTNQVVITATDNDANTSVVRVTVEYVGGKVWPMPYSIDWSSVGSIDNVQDVAQIVDGLWTVEGDYIRPVGASSDTYDRLAAIGDVSWVDYEVTVPITIHWLSDGGGPGVGILVRWNGHGDDSEQPHYDHPFGGLGWYRILPGSDDARLSIMGNGGEDIATDYSGRRLEFNVPYVFKMRVETEPSGKSLYSLKVWEVGSPEPSAWDLSGYGHDIDSDERHGSLLLVAHRTDGSFGDVTVTPIQEQYTLMVNTVGEGTVSKEPDQDVFYYGDVVTLTATANPDWTFAGWSGDLSGTENPTTITMDGDKTVTATFTQDEYTLTVNTVGNGTVTKDPDQATYHYGDVVTLTATADPGWTFAGWSGHLSGSNNPETITMDGNKTIIATFTQDEYTLTVNVVGEGTVTKEPDQATYHYGDVVTLIANADPGWSFGGWSGDLSGNESTKTITMDGDKTVTATFVSYRIFLPLIAR